jgi:hypothetical protein
MKITLDILSEKASQELAISKRLARHIYKNLLKSFHYNEVAATSSGKILVVGLGKFIIKNDAVRFKVSEYMHDKIANRGISDDAFVGLGSDIVLKTMVKAKTKPHKTIAESTECYKQAIDLFFKTIAQSIIDYDDVSITGIGRIKISPVWVENNFSDGKETVRVTFTPYCNLKRT